MKEGWIGADVKVLPSSCETRSYPNVFELFADHITGTAKLKALIPDLKYAHKSSNIEHCPALTP